MSIPTTAHLSAAKALYSAGILAATEAQLGSVAQVIAAAMEKHEQHDTRNNLKPLYQPHEHDLWARLI